MAWEKEFEYKQGAFVLPARLAVKAEEEAAKKAVWVLGSFLEETGITLAEDSSAAVVLERADGLRQEGYRLSVTTDQIRIQYADFDGARNAVVTLYNRIEKQADQYVVPCMEILDWPDAGFRGTMLDMARQFIPVETVKRDIRLMALAKMNQLVLHLMDSGHYAIHSDVCPELNGKSGLQQYTKAEMTEIVDYAARYGIHVVPSLDMPAHASHLIECYGLGCEVDDDHEYSNWAVCVGNEKTYEILGRLIGEAVELFPDEYFAAFGDELEFLDIDFEKLWLNWEHCRVCREMAKREGITGKQEMFYYFIRRIHAILKQYGKTMWVANDNIDIAKSPDIPRDIVIIWWRIPAEGRGPVEGHSMVRFLEEGFRMINIEYPDCYLDLYMKEEKLADWTPLKRPYCPPEYADQMLGGYMCVWEGKRHFEWTLPSGIIMFGDKLWDYRDRVYDVDYRKRLTRILLGAKTEPDMDVFSLLGGCLLPLDIEVDRKGYPDRVGDAEYARMDDMIKSLAALEQDNPREKALCGVYADCIRWMQEHRPDQTL